MKKKNVGSNSWNKNLVKVFFRRVKLLFFDEEDNEDDDAFTMKKLMTFM